MCKNPLRIKNKGKYITENTGYQYYIWVNCGKCDECIRAKQNEWNLRTYYEVLNTLNNGGENAYVYFDTLTYSNENLPRLSKLTNVKENYPCFNYKHIRNFYEKLRQHLKLNKDSKLKYFVTSEYGDIRHRPHYHIMLFVNDLDIDPITLSKAVNECWGLGRTDGIPWKSKKYVMEHNYINKINLNAIRYIAKYVNKSQTYMEIINKRWEKLEKFYNISKFNKLEIKKIKQQYYRLTTPFHRQSRGFGIYALSFTNIEQINELPILTYRDDSLAITKKIKLPMYYYRKIFAEQFKMDGKRFWRNTNIGIKFKQNQEEKIRHAIKNRLLDAQATIGTNILDDELATKIAHYILIERGRLSGKIDYANHYNEATIFNYTSDRDIKYIGKIGTTSNFIGNDVIGYKPSDWQDINIEDKIYINNEYEKIISQLTDNQDNSNMEKLKEHMREIKKIYFSR